MSSIFGGSQQQSNYTSTPQNLQNPAYTGLSPSVAQSLQQLFGGGPSYNGPGSALGSNIFTPQSGVGNVSGNPLVAGLSDQQMQLINAAVGQAMSNQNQGMANSAIGSILSGTYMNPNSYLTAAQNSATAPLVSAFQNTTMPAMSGQFTAAGQNTGNANGSSAFQKAGAIAQTGLEQSIAGVTAPMAFQNYETGLQQLMPAAAASVALPAAQINNLVQSLQAASLPQMTEQYGINQGLQLFQQRIQTLMQALGLGGQVSQPALASSSSGTGAGAASPDLLSGIGNAATGLGKLANSGGLSSVFGDLFGGGSGAAGAAGGADAIGEVAPLLMLA